MGTKGLIGHILNGGNRGIYSHMDSYPSELGRKVLSLVADLNRDHGWDSLRGKLSTISVVDPVGTPDKTAVDLYGSRFRAGLVSANVRETWSGLLWGLRGVDCYRRILSGELHHFPDAYRFIHEPLFCEYAYILNLDGMKLDLFAGHQGGMLILTHPGQRHDGGVDTCQHMGSIPFTHVRDAASAYPIMENQFNRRQTTKNNQQGKSMKNTTRKELTAALPCTVVTINEIGEQR